MNKLYGFIPNNKYGYLGVRVISFPEYIYYQLRKVDRLGNLLCEDV